LTELTKLEDNVVAIRAVFLNLLALGLLTVSVAACGDTWEGIKQDTGDNLEATGEAVEDAGEAVKPEG
jgi:hypothetical protein